MKNFHLTHLHRWSTLEKVMVVDYTLKHDVCNPNMRKDYVVTLIHKFLKARRKITKGQSATHKKSMPHLSGVLACTRIVYETLKEKEPP